MQWQSTDIVILVISWILGGSCPTVFEICLECLKFNDNNFLLQNVAFGYRLSLNTEADGGSVTSKNSLILFALPVIMPFMILKGPGYQRLTYCEWN